MINSILDQAKLSLEHIVIPYADLYGSNFFEKINYLRDLFFKLDRHYDLSVVEDRAIPKNPWGWNIPFSFDQKFKLVEFSLEPSKKIRCGSIWIRPSDKTIIAIEAIEGRKVYVKVKSGPGLMSNVLNFGALELFWNRILR